MGHLEETTSRVHRAFTRTLGGAKPLYVRCRRASRGGHPARIRTTTRPREGPKASRPSVRSQRCRSRPFLPSLHNRAELFLQNGTRQTESTSRWARRRRVVAAAAATSQMRAGGNFRRTAVLGKSFENRIVLRAGCERSLEHQLFSPAVSVRGRGWDSPRWHTYWRVLPSYRSRQSPSSASAP